MFTLWRRAAPALAVCVFLAAGGAGRAAEGDEHLVMGNPSDATADKAKRNNYLIKRRQYALSYNNSKGTPNWVSWHLSKDWLGRTPRRDLFAPDRSLPEGFFVVRPADYEGAGFDRGHMCPAADRNASEADMRATFLMTNMVPQSEANNRHTWEKLEIYCRDQAKEGKELFIVAGPAGRGAFGSKGYRNFIRGKGGKILVPGKTWKVVLVLPGGVKNPRKVTAKTARAFAVIVPNNELLNSDWRQYSVTVQDVEDLTGYRFFSALPDDVARELKAREDVRARPTSKKPGKDTANKTRADAKEEFAKVLAASKKATVVKASFGRSKRLAVREGGRVVAYNVTKDTMVSGPRGGKRHFTAKDAGKVLKPGAEVRIVPEGKTLKALILPGGKPK
jgi:endonuclease G